jgi:hypothetical protein
MVLGYLLACSSARRDASPYRHCRSVRSCSGAGSAWRVGRWIASSTVKGVSASACRTLSLALFAGPELCVLSSAPPRRPRDSPGRAQLASLFANGSSHCRVNEPGLTLAGSVPTQDCGPFQSGRPQGRPESTSDCSIQRVDIGVWLPSRLSSVPNCAQHACSAGGALAIPQIIPAQKLLGVKWPASLQSNPFCDELPDQMRVKQQYEWRRV